MYVVRVCVESDYYAFHITNDVRPCYCVYRAILSSRQGSCRDPEPNEQIILSYVSCPKGEWVAATSGTASVGASATPHTLPNKGPQQTFTQRQITNNTLSFLAHTPLAPLIPLSPVVVPYLYAGARRTELHEAARFMLLLESGKWAEAAQMSILKSVPLPQTQTLTPLLSHTRTRTHIL